MFKVISSKYQIVVILFFSSVPDAAVKTTANRTTDSTTTISLPTVWTSSAEIVNGENCWVGTYDTISGTIDVQPATMFDSNECSNQFGASTATSNGLFCAAQPATTFGNGNAQPPICMPNWDPSGLSNDPNLAFSGYGAPLICEVNGVATMMGIYAFPDYATGDCGPGIRSEFYYFTEQEASNIQNIMDYNNNYEAHDTSVFENISAGKLN